MNTSLREVIGLLRKGLLTPKEICDRCITRAEKVRELNAFITERHDLAREEAERANERFLNGQPLGILDGIPMAVKDNFSTRGLQTSCASRMLHGYVPPYDATVVHRMLREGAILMGKTNMDEFAMGTGSTDSCYGPVRNPWKYKFASRNAKSAARNVTNTTTDRKSNVEAQRHFHHSTAVNAQVKEEEEEDDDWYICGGSSGGSAVSVATGICFTAVGSDTGGSVRSPAAHVGVVGLKPTYGLVSRHGLIPLVNSLDVPGIFARYVDDAAIVLNTIAGHCPHDSTTIRRSYTDIQLPDNVSLKGVKVGIPKEFHGPVLDGDTLNCWRRVADAMETEGAEIVEVSLPHTRHSIPAYSVICAAEVASNMARYDGIEYGHRSGDSWSTEDLFASTRHEGFNDVVRGRILAGNYFLLRENYEKFFVQAMKVRRLIWSDFQTAFRRVDVLLTPCNVSDATTYADFRQEDNRTRTAQYDIYTQSVNLSGVPAVTIPTDISTNKLPIGLQIIGDHFTEKQILYVAKWLENYAQFPRLDLEQTFNDS